MTNCFPLYASRGVYSGKYDCRATKNLAFYGKLAKTFMSMKKVASLICGVSAEDFRCQMKEYCTVLKIFHYVMPAVRVLYTRIIYVQPVPKHIRRSFMIIYISIKNLFSRGVLYSQSGH